MKKNNTPSPEYDIDWFLDNHIGLVGSFTELVPFSEDDTFCEAPLFKEAPNCEREP